MHGLSVSGFVQAEMGTACASPVWKENNMIWLRIVIVLLGLAAIAGSIPLWMQPVRISLKEFLEVLRKPSSELPLCGRRALLNYLLADAISMGSLALLVMIVGVVLIVVAAFSPLS
jgi:hypothetical protein